MSLEIVSGVTPILDLARQVRECLASKGYGEQGLNRYQNIWNHFARYAGNSNFSIEIGTTFLQNAYGIEWAEFPPPMKRYQRRSLSAIRYLRDYELTGEIAIHRPMKPSYIWPGQFVNAVDLFLRYMNDAGYSKDHMRGEIRVVHGLLEFLSDCGVQSCKDINISDVMAYVHEHYDHIAVSTLKTQIARIRSFLKFLYLNELNHCDIAALIPPVREFKLSQIPVVWKKDDVSRILTSIDRETPGGKRDYAIFMLAINCGLRISDILHLQFSNIDWEQAVIQISQVKTDERLSFPLSKEIGWALIDYIKNGRPQSDSARIFIRHCAPFQAFGVNNNFHYQMCKYVALAGVAPPSPNLYGIHSLRRTFATNLLKEGTSLSLISELLGHNGVSATPIYLKVDEAHLRLCALDPEIEVADDV